MIILNSKIPKFYINTKFNSIEKLFPYIRIEQLKQVPIPIANNQQSFIDKADTMLALNKDLQAITNSFLDLLLAKLPMEKPTGKLKDWHELTAKEFLKELNKNINKENRSRRKNEQAELEKPSLKQEQEWLAYFTEEHAKANTLQQQITTTDKEIDQMVYELYELTEEEIEIVEGS